MVADGLGDLGQGSSMGPRLRYGRYRLWPLGGGLYRVARSVVVKATDEPELGHQDTEDRGKAQENQ